MRSNPKFEVGTVLRGVRLSCDDGDPDIEELVTKTPVLIVITDTEWNRNPDGAERTGEWDATFLAHDGTAYELIFIPATDRYRSIPLNRLTGQECATLAKWRLTRG